MFYNRLRDKNDKLANFSLQLYGSFIMNPLISIKCLHVVNVALVSMAEQL